MIAQDASRKPSARRGAQDLAAGPLPVRGEHETRARILNAAFRLFHKHGYHATGVSSIVRAAKVNVGSVYHFFPGKDALLVGVLEYALTLLRPAVMDPAERRSDDPIERVFELLQQYRAEMAASGCRMGCPIGNLALEVSDSDARARGLIRQNFDNWIGAVTQWLESAGDRLPQSVHRAQLAGFVLTVMEGGIMRARAAGDLRPFDESVSQLRSYFVALELVAASERSGKPHVHAPAALDVPRGGTSARSKKP